MISVLIFVIGIAAVSADGSWQSYVDDQLVGAGMKGAAIFGLDGAIWAKNNVATTEAEGKQIIALFNNPANVFAVGIKFGGVNYLGIKGDSQSLYGKKGAGGVVVVKTTQAVLVGAYDENLQPGNAVNIAEKLGDFLRDNGY